jgi:hypothetical protein
MPFSDLDKIYWLRAGLGMLGGALAEFITGCKVILAPPNAGACAGGLRPDYTTGITLGIFLFLGSYYLLNATIGSRFNKDQRTKLYTTGVGTYTLLYLFTWILLYTLGVAYLNL